MQHLLISQGGLLAQLPLRLLHLELLPVQLLGLGGDLVPAPSAHFIPQFPDDRDKVFHGGRGDLVMDHQPLKHDGNGVGQGLHPRFDRFEGDAEPVCVEEDLYGEWESKGEGQGVDAHHVGIYRSEDFASEPLETVGEPPGESVGGGETREVVGQSIVCGNGHEPGLADPTSKRLAEPLGPFDKVFGADQRAEGVSGGLLVVDMRGALQTYEPMGAPIPLDKHSEAVSNGCSSSVNLQVSVDGPFWRLHDDSHSRAVSLGVWVQSTLLDDLGAHVPYPRAVQVQGDVVFPTQFANLDHLVLREDDPGQGVFKADELGGGRVDVVPEHEMGFDVVGGEVESVGRDELVGRALGEHGDGAGWCVSTAARWGERWWAMSVMPLSITHLPSCGREPASRR